MPRSPSSVCAGSGNDECGATAGGTRAEAAVARSLIEAMVGSANQFRLGRNLKREMGREQKSRWLGQLIVPRACDGMCAACRSNAVSSVSGAPSRQLPAAKFHCSWTWHGARAFARLHPCSAMWRQCSQLSVQVQGTAAGWAARPETCKRSAFGWQDARSGGMLLCEIRRRRIGLLHPSGILSSDLARRWSRSATPYPVRSTLHV